MPTSARRSPISSTRALPLHHRHGPPPLRPGHYRYFDRPLPAEVGALRESFYAHLAPIANRWAELLGEDVRFPETHGALLDRCAEAGQRRPTPLILRYGAGDWNALHQDLYGDVYFPFQAVTVLDEPGVDFEGGEFVLMEQRPRAQSRAHVLTPPRGAFVLFPTRQRPQLGAAAATTGSACGTASAPSTRGRGQRSASSSTTRRERSATRGAERAAVLGAPRTVPRWRRSTRAPAAPRRTAAGGRGRAVTGVGRMRGSRRRASRVERFAAGFAGRAAAAVVPRAVAGLAAGFAAAALRGRGLAGRRRAAPAQA